MAKKKAAENSTIETKLIPLGFIEGNDVNEFLSQFGFNPDEDDAIEFIKINFNID